ncbi:MAG: sigma-54-dependent Fis family transcriptional regulator [Ignavibacteriales bacterium]|nr:sigma-54-dependent Fis family transcriptional regulator [Ignavibacteriales bacterium]
MNNITVVEDNDTMRLGITESLIREGYNVNSFSNGPEAINFINENNTDISIVDVKMEPMNGLVVLEKIKEKFQNIDVLIISAYGNVETAVDAMKKGAADYLTKPFSPDELRIRVKKILDLKNKQNQINALIEQNKYLTDELLSDKNELIGSSEKFIEVIKMAERIADSESSVLIQGETGTGKELIAKLIHKKSSRSDGPFIKVNCAAINDNLLESELFGHEKGAFTGAVKSKKGRFELANNGTIFLDEIGDISQAMQVKILRVLQEKEFEKIGGESTIKVDVRIISATNKNLSKEVVNNNFREDLFYRLNVVPITLPTLRERREDVKLLSEYFLKKTGKTNNQKSKIISDAGIEVLQNYSWPGNVRELENLIERLSVIAQENEINADLISAHLNPQLQNFSNYNNLSLDDTLFSFEKNLIIDALKKTDGNKNQAAKLLKINTSTLYYKLEKYDLLN